jgi:uncharacterized C2H2 Zn-finger protein
MADMKQMLKCSKCGYVIKESGKCPRCGTIVQCSMSCSGNCLKCSLEAKKQGKEKN